MDITEQGTATQEGRRRRRIASKGRRSVTPGASDGSYPPEDWFGRTRLFESYEDDRSVNRHSISFERIHPEDLSSAPQVSEAIETKLSVSYAAHVLRK